MTRQTTYIEQIHDGTEWRTHAVYTDGRSYDVEWCIRDSSHYGKHIGETEPSVLPGRIVEADGSTARGRHRVWAAPGVTIVGEIGENSFEVLAGDGCER